MLSKRILPSRSGVAMVFVASVLLAACASDKPDESPWHDLEAIKLEAIYQFVKLQTDDEEKSRALAEQYYEEKKLVLKAVREGRPAMASNVENAHVLDAGKFLLSLRGDLTFWLLQNNCSIIEETIRATAGTAHIAAIGLGQQDAQELGSIDESRIDLILVEILDRRRIELVGLPHPPPGKSLVILGDVKISGVCQELASGRLTRPRASLR